MASSSLRAVLTGDFLNRLGNTNTSSLTRGSTKSILSPSSTTNISNSLRIGTRTLTTAVDNLNLVSSVLNLSRTSLQELGKITDELIEIAEQGTKSGQSKQERANLQRRFDKAAKEFNDIFEGAHINDIEYLEKDSLQQLFEDAGLDVDTSYSIATVFEAFVLSPGDKSFASEEIKSERPISIPIGAYSGEKQVIKHEVMHTDSFLYDSNQGLVSSFANHIVAEDVNGDSSGDDTFNVLAVENIETMLQPGLTDHIELKAVSAEGYSVFVSSDDFLGTNVGGDAQLFISDKAGNVIQQLTSFSDLTVGASRIMSVDISADGKSVLVDYEDTTNSGYLELYQVSSFGDSPASVSTTMVDSIATTAAYSDVHINENGTQIIYTERGSSSSLNIYDVAGTTYSSFVKPTATKSTYDFYSTDVIGIVHWNTGDPEGEGTVSTYDIKNTTLNSAVGTISSIDVTKVAFVENAERLVYANEGGGRVGMYTLGALGTSLAETGPQFFVDAGDNIVTLSAAQRADNGLIDVGIIVNDSSGGDRDFLVLENENDETLTSREIFNQVTSDPHSAYVTSVGNVIESTDETYDYNNGYRSIGFEIEAGQSVSVRTTFQDVLSDGEAFLNGGVDAVLAVDSQSGYALIRSAEDFLGYNQFHYDQVYVVDRAGKVISQVSDNDGTEKYNVSDIGVGGRKIALGVSDLSNGGKRIDLISLSKFGTDPSTHSVTTAQTFTGNSIIANVKMEKNGTHVLYSGRNNGTLIANAYTVAGGVIEEFGSNFSMLAGNYGFIDTNVFATVRENDSGTYDIVSYDLNKSSYEVLESGINAIPNYQGLTADQTRAGYAIVYNDEGVDQIGIISSKFTDEVREFYQQSQGDTPTIFSIAEKNDGTIYLGIGGELHNRSSDPTAKFHRFEITSESISVGENFSTTTKEYNSVFDVDRTILTRPDAYQMLADLNELADQIGDNLEAIDGAQDTLAQNIELVRSLGQAFINQSEQISSEDEADSVAQKIRQLVTTDARSALTQAENLESIIVAALTADPTSITGS